MKLESKIKAALGYKGMSQAALARAMNTTPSNFNQKLKRGTVSIEELEQISKILECEFVLEFKFPDGMTI